MDPVIDLRHLEFPESTDLVCGESTVVNGAIDILFMWQKHCEYGTKQQRKARLELRARNDWGS